MKPVINPDGKYTVISGSNLFYESYTARAGSSLCLCFPRLLICVPRACSFLPSFQHHSGNSSSLGWKDQRAQARPSKGNANHYLDLEEEGEEEERHLYRKNLLSFFEYNLLSQTQRNHGSCLYSRLSAWKFLNSKHVKVQQSPMFIGFFRMSFPTSTFSPSCSFKCFKSKWDGAWKVLTFISREACPGAFFFMRVSIVSSILSSQNEKPTCNTKS